MVSSKGAVDDQRAAVHVQYAGSQSLTEHHAHGGIVDERTVPHGRAGVQVQHPRSRLIPKAPIRVPGPNRKSIKNRGRVDRHQEAVRGHDVIAVFAVVGSVGPVVFGEIAAQDGAVGFRIRVALPAIGFGTVKAAVQGHAADQPERRRARIGRFSALRGSVGAGRHPDFVARCRVAQGEFEVIKRIGPGLAGAGTRRAGADMKHIGQRVGALTEHDERSA